MKQRSMRILGALLSLMLLICLTGPCQVKAEQENESLTLSDSKPEENQSFQVSNMIPGEEYTQTYRIEVNYKKAKVVSFRASVSEGSKKLAEAMQITVKRMDTEEILFSGALAGMSWVDWNLSQKSKLTAQELVYEVTVFLDRSLSNEYQDQSVTIKLDWQMEKGSGTSLWVWLCVIVFVLALAALAVAFFLIRSSKIAKDAARITGNIIMVITLIFCWSITTYALAWHQVAVEQNSFTTGVLKLNLNDGEPVFDEELYFEPGLMIQRNFTIANEGNIDAIYRLWISNIEGELDDELTVEIRDGKKLIFDGIFEDFIEEKVYGNNTTLLANEIKELTILIYLPEECDNTMQGKAVSFRLNYDAVQKDGNPNKDFE